MKPKLYLLCSASASPEASGGKRRIMQNQAMMRALYDAELLPYAKQKGIRGKVAYFFAIRKKLARSEWCLIEEPKYIFVTLFLPVRCLYSAHNFETALRWDFFKRARSLRAFMRFLLFFVGEFLAIRRAEMILAISQTLQGQLARYTRRPIFVVSPFPEGDVAARRTHAGCFHYACVGSFDWGPNRDGYRFFIDEVLPRLSGGNRRFYFVGKNNDKTPTVSLNGNVVVCQGYIDDLNEFYAEMDGVIIPIVSGSGIKMKLLEALGKALPIVTTVKGVEGLEPYGDLLGAAADAEAFAERIAALERAPDSAAAAALEVRDALIQEVRRQQQAFFAFLERSA